ncbi:hypothetical protein BUE80_DR009575 [Diplocarpon rosae]|nr:hypothetical protein BUE80_DR009575 [Diplocarpon rosae]
MERHRETHERHDQPKELSKDSSNRQRPQHYDGSREPDRRAHKDLSSAKTRSGRASGRLPKDMEALSGSKEYIRRWLATTESNDNQNTMPVSRPTNAGRHNDIGAQGAACGLRPAAHIYEDQQISTRGKRRHKSSSDSSLLEVPMRPQTTRLKRDDPHPTISKRRDQPTFRKKQKMPHSDHGSSSHASSHNPPRETFEKRARHKTREDRYEPKKKEERSEKTGEARKKRENRGDRRRAAKKSGEKLMQNFSSKNVARDRLTMRPRSGPGLFTNGRASSPARRRGLPDLAFSEMDFLQRSSRKGPAENRERVTSKCHEKEKRKVTRAQEEISTFFGPMKMPLQKVSTNTTKAYSSSAKNDRSIYAKRMEQDQNQMTSSYERSGSFDFQQERPCSKGRPGQPSHEHKAYGSYSRAASNPMEHPGSASKLSSKATSTLSWSESQFSPAITTPKRVLDRLSVSPTPSSVWRSIENTGIFKGTGIKITPAPRNKRQSSMTLSMYENQIRDQTQIWKGLSERTGPTTTTADSSEMGRGLFEVGLQGQERSVSSNRSISFRDPQAQPENNISRDQIDTAGQTAASRQRLVVEHFHPQLGWHEHPHAISRSQQTSAAAMREAIPRDFRSTPRSRDEIAKHARLKLPKRPSTTLPIINHNVGENEQVAGMGISNSRPLKIAIKDDSQVSEEHPEDAIGGTQSAAYRVRLASLASSSSDPTTSSTRHRLPISHVIEGNPPGSLSGYMMSLECSEQPHTDTTMGEKQQSSLPRPMYPQVRLQLSEEIALGDGPEGESEACDIPYKKESWIGNVRPVVPVQSIRGSLVSEDEPFYIHQIQRDFQNNPSNSYQQSSSGVKGLPPEHLNTHTIHHEDHRLDDLQYLEDSLESNTRGYGGKCSTTNQAYEDMNAEYAERYGNRDLELYHDEQEFVGHNLIKGEIYDFEHAHQYNHGESFYDALDSIESHKRIYKAEPCDGYDRQMETPGAGFWQPRPRY